MNKRFFICCLFICATGAVFAQPHSLDFYISRALENSPLLNDYRNQVASSRFDSLLITAGYKPQVTGNSNDMYAPIIKGFGYDQAITNGGIFNALVGVNKAFVSRKNLSAQFGTLQFQNQGVQNTAKISEQDLRRTITEQYITAYGDEQQLEFANQVIGLLKKEELVLKTLTEKNVYRQTDYLTFLVTMQQQELSSRQLMIQFQNDFATLNYTAGIFDTATAALEEPSLAVSQLPPIENSIFFRQYTIDSLNLLNEKLLVDFSYKPKLSVFADAGYNSSFAYQPYKNFGTSFGVNLTVPIYDGKKRKLQYSKLAISERTRQGYKSFAGSQYYQQIAQLKNQLQATEALLTQINNQIKYSESLINVNAKLLETGDARIPDLVIALNNYMTAKNLQTQNAISRLHIINQLNYWNQ